MSVAQSNTPDWAPMAENAEIRRPLLALLVEVRWPRCLFWGFAREMLLMLNPAWPQLGKPGDGSTRQAGDLSIL